MGIVELISLRLAISFTAPYPKFGLYVSLLQEWIQRFLKGGTLCRPPWLVAEENFRFQIVCKGQNNFGEIFLSVFLNFLHFYIQWKFADEILSIFQNLQTLLWGKGNNTHIGVNEKKKKREREVVVQRCSFKNVFLKFRKIHRKTPVPEPLF